MKSMSVVNGNNMGLFRSPSEESLEMTSPTRATEMRIPMTRPNKKNMHENTLSISDVVGTSSRQFGMNFYRSPSNEMLLKKIKNG